jgi:hypothetical protein
MRAARVLLLAAAAVAGCARKNPPLPPEGAPADLTPQLRAPAIVTDPIDASED